MHIHNDIPKRVNVQNLPQYNHTCEHIEISSYVRIIYTYYNL